MRKSMLMTLGMSFLATTVLATAPGPGAEFTGTWDVEKVAVDSRDKPHWNFIPDDPLLMGRELVVDGEHVRFNFGDDLNCNPANWARHSTDWNFLFGAGLLRSASSGKAEPTAADYSFNVLPPGKPVISYSFCTRITPKVGGRWVMGPWLVPFGSQRIMVHLGTQTVLVLARRPIAATPRASFPCAKAATPTEKAICGSIALAAWDRSVALAWRQATQNGADPGKVQEQKEWLRTRNACGTDTACLETEMRNRTGDLLRQ